ncbi:carbamoyltransferase C-terminal domain-containing protein [Parabacteroides bouchesdurhonensis]|uniref:carbamoyltransferase C-terminal domain-containing protein n=1 Tax=Parabacteroides bouchesdurhonensis TaxID=1936995 RepID=UPI001D0CBE60|nr:carbamoyltransferase C-terminal domain-containing protein [Parabacteroides bouchesdurhonensis]
MKQDRIIQTPDSMSGSYLGPSFSDTHIHLLIRKTNAQCIKLDNNALYSKVASLLNDGMIVGWFQGRMEFGPRALGNRSILADPRNTCMQKKLNLEIKFRESFRPFAPSILEEDVSKYFDMNETSPYMLKVANISASQRLPLPKNYETLPYLEKLYINRSILQAITHVDFSARVQTVSQQTNPQYYSLLSAFKKLTGCSVLVNTSFNVRGEPIVCTPDDAYRCFMSTGMNYLVIGNWLFAKENQPLQNIKSVPDHWTD